MALVLCVLFRHNAAIRKYYRKLSSRFLQFDKRNRSNELLKVLVGKAKLFVMSLNSLVMIFFTNHLLEKGW
jgi:hypothetical protein